jgi:hypothetical protein
MTARCSSISRPARTSRVVTAAQARLDGPDRSGRIVLNLNDFTSHTFADAHPMPNDDGADAA